MKLVSCTLAAMAWFAAPVSGQGAAGLGTLEGCVRDASGGRISGAKVVVRNAQRGMRRAVASDGAGLFSAASLRPGGGYGISVSKPGFVTLEQTGMEIVAGRNAMPDVVLQVAGNTVEIDLDGGVPQSVAAMQVAPLPAGLHAPGTGVGRTAGGRGAAFAHEPGVAGLARAPYCSIAAGWPVPTS